jgi:hypothetical protein
MSATESTHSLAQEGRTALVPQSIGPARRGAGVLPRTRQGLPPGDVALMLAHKGLSLPRYFDHRQHAASTQASLRWPALASAATTENLGK